MTSVTAKGLFDVPSKLYLGLRWEINYWDQIDGKNVRKDVPDVKAPKMDTTKYPLGFVTYFDSDNQAWRKRKDTVDTWSDMKRAKAVMPSADGIFLDNDPLDGFQIFDFESRWTTSNKWFCVKDPRGFHLQISAAALIDLLNHTDIKKGGFIQGKCLWGRRDGTNIVVPVDSDLYRETVRVNNSPKTYGIGDVVIIGKNELVFVGEYWELDINVHPFYEEPQRRVSSIWGTPRGTRHWHFNFNNYYNKNPKDVIQVYPDNYYNGGYNSNGMPTDDELKTRLSYDIVKETKYTPKKVYIFASYYENNKRWMATLYTSAPKIKGVIGQYVPPAGAPDVFESVINNTYEGEKHTPTYPFDIQNDVYGAYSHRFNYQKKWYFKEKSERDAFDVKALLDSMPNRIELVSAESFIDDTIKDTRMKDRNYKVTYKAVF